VDSRENRPMAEREADTEIPDHFLKLARIFIEASKIFILFLFFSSTRHPKNLKPAAHGHKVLIQFNRPSKKYSSGEPVPLK
jgi:hypothetical protein